MKNTSLLLVILFCIFTLLTSCWFMPSDQSNNPSDAPGVHKCESECVTCGKCTDDDCVEEVCAQKCNGHINLPEIGVDDLK
jgi:hypothetical protein